MKTEELSNKERDREGGNWEFRSPLSERLLPKLEELESRREIPRLELHRECRERKEK